jgi:hypothetical protein
VERDGGWWMGMVGDGGTWWMVMVYGDGEWLW